jgi:predicted HTH transcriptional regulator
MKGTIELSNRAKLVYEASMKIQKGEQLLTEGKIELEQLLGKDRSRDMTKAVKDMIPEKRTKHLTANRTARKKVGGRNGLDPIVEKERSDTVLNFIRSNDWVSFTVLRDNVDFSDKPINRALAKLKKEKKIKKVFKKGNPALTDPRARGRMSTYWEAV